MEKEGGNRERMRKCRESISLHFLIFSISSSFPHSLFISSQPGCKAATIRAALSSSISQSCQPVTLFGIFNTRPNLHLLIYYKIQSDYFLNAYHRAVCAHQLIKLTSHDDQHIILYHHTLHCHSNSINNS